MTEFAAFVASILDDLDGAGAFADYLDERNDPRGTLLRRRWKRWQKDRWAALAAEERARTEAAAPVSGWGRVKMFLQLFFGELVPAKKEKGTSAVDSTFRKYLRRKFASETPPAPKRKT